MIPTVAMTAAGSEALCRAIDDKQSQGSIANAVWMAMESVRYNPVDMHSNLISAPAPEVTERQYPVHHDQPAALWFMHDGWSSR